MVQCKGKTKNGTRCIREAVKGSVYCWQHKKNTQSPKKKSPQRKSAKSPKKYFSGEEQQKKYCSCIQAVKLKSPQVNPYAICTASVGRIRNSCKEYE